MKRQRALETVDDAICKKIKLEEEIFPFGELLPEMQGEARDRMSPLALALFALTSKENYVRYGEYKKRTALYWEMLIREGGTYAFFCSLRDFVGSPWVEDPLALVLTAVECNNEDFIIHYFVEEPYVPNYLLQHKEMINKMADQVGRYASPTVARVLWPRLVDRVPFDTHTRIILSAALYSNDDFIKAFGPMWVQELLDVAGGVATGPMPDRRKLSVLCCAFGSCSEETVGIVSAICDIPVIRIRHQFINIPRDAAPLTIGYLQFMQNLKCSPSASAVICNALRYCNGELLEYALMTLGCKLGDLDTALSVCHTPAQRPLFERLFKQREHYVRPGAVLTRIQGGTSMFGIDELLKYPDILSPSFVRKASSKIMPSTIFHLVDNHFPLHFTALLNCVIRHDDPRALVDRRFHHFNMLTHVVSVLSHDKDPLSLLDCEHMPRDNALFTLLIRYNATRLIPFLIDWGYIGLSDAIGTVQTALEKNEVTHIHTINGGLGLRQLLVTLRYLLYRENHTTASWVASTLLQVSLLKLPEQPVTPFVQPLLKQVYQCLAESSATIPVDTVQTCLQQATDARHPDACLQILAQLKIRKR